MRPSVRISGLITAISLVVFFTFVVVVNIGPVSALRELLFVVLASSLLAPFFIFFWLIYTGDLALVISKRLQYLAAVTAILQASLAFPGLYSLIVQIRQAPIHVRGFEGITVAEQIVNWWRGSSEPKDLLLRVLNAAVSCGMLAFLISLWNERINEADDVKKPPHFIYFLAGSMLAFAWVFTALIVAGIVFAAMSHGSHGIARLQSGPTAMQILLRGVPTLMGPISAILFAYVIFKAIPHQNDHDEGGSQPPALDSQQSL